MRATRLTALLLAAGLGVSYGCGTGDGPTEPGPDDTLSFQFFGLRTGTFSVEAVPEFRNGTIVWQSFATGIRVPGTVETGVYALHVQGELGHAVLLILPNRQQATYRLGSDCTEPARCAEASLAFDLLRNAPAEAHDIYVFESGTITITHASNSRLRGTFSGVALREDATAGEEPVTIGSGSFDVALRTGIVLGEPGAAGAVLQPGAQIAPR